MSKEKQIEEICAIMSNEVYMACEDTPLVPESSDICEYLDCRLCKQARLLINAGYRKQSEGEWTYSESKKTMKCTRCRLRMKTYDVQRYCPNCGAKMKGDK